MNRRRDDAGRARVSGFRVDAPVIPFRHVKKKEREWLDRLRRLRGFSEDERILFARSLAATPDERWARCVRHRQLLNSCAHSGLKASVSKSRG
jgi:hypothetical protein